jgi:hypothetical protein
MKARRTSDRWLGRRRWGEPKLPEIPKTVKPIALGPDVDRLADAIRDEYRPAVYLGPWSFARPKDVRAQGQGRRRLRKTVTMDETVNEVKGSWRGRRYDGVIGQNDLVARLCRRRPGGPSPADGTKGERRCAPSSRWRPGQSAELPPAWGIGPPSSRRNSHRPYQAESIIGWVWAGLDAVAGGDESLARTARSHRFAPRCDRDGRVRAAGALHPTPWRTPPTPPHQNRRQP